MVRALDAATQGAVRNPALVIPRNFVLITVKDLATGVPETFGFTDYGEDVSLDILDGETRTVVNRTYYGDNSPISKMDPVPLKIGLEVDTTQITLNHIHPVVQLMARGHDLRNAKVQIHRAYLDPASMMPVAPPRPRRLGQVNGAPIQTPAIGGEGSITLRVVSHTRELSRINSSKRSDETQRLRSGDRFNRYAGTAYKWEIWWGEVKDGQSTGKGGGYRGKKGR